MDKKSEPISLIKCLKNYKQRIELKTSSLTTQTSIYQLNLLTIKIQIYED